MFNSLQLSTSDCIQVAGLIASLVVSLIAIIISVLTLKQNSKMIEESTRPNIVIYNDIVSADSPIQYLIMRNFGNSSATIIDLHLLYTGDPKYSKTLFSHMKGQVIAPGQSYSTAFKFDDYSTVIEAKVSYVSEAGKKYSSVFHIHQMAFTDNAHAKSSPRSSDEALKIIAASFQDFLRSRL